MEDPEIIEDFCSESSKLLIELEEILDELEDDPNDYSRKLENFGQIIDRIMGAAKSIQADEIALFCDLGKIIGYKSSQIEDKPLINVVIAVLFDAVDLLNGMISSLKSKDNTKLNSLNTEAFSSRLRWLSEKFKHIERSSVAYKDEEKNKKTDANEKMDQASIDDLIDALGI